MLAKKHSMEHRRSIATTTTSTTASSSVFSLSNIANNINNNSNHGSSSFDLGSIPDIPRRIPPRIGLLRHLSGFLESKRDLMNDWEIGGTQNKWVCPSDRHLQLRAQLKSGWSNRTATARSPTNSKGQNGIISDAEQEHIRQVLAKAEESRQKEQQRIGKMVDRLEKMRRRATGNGVTHCLLCHTEFGLLASKSYAAMCVDCRKYVCQRNCGVETQDPSRGGELVFLCKICAEAREVLWKKSGAWFYKEMPDFQRPDMISGPSTSYANGSAIMMASPPIAIPPTGMSSPRQPSWAMSQTSSPVPSGSPVAVPRRPTNEVPSTSRASICSMLQAIEQPERSKSPRPRIQPSWVKEKVMSSMSIDDEEKAVSSDGESSFAQSGIIRRPPKSSNNQTTIPNRREANLARFAMNAGTIYDSEDDSSPESHASTRSTTSPRRSLATPCSYDASATQDINQHDDVRSIDSGVVQSDHSNPQQGALTLSSSSLTPITQSHNNNQCESPRRVSNAEPSSPNVTQRISLVTPPPLPSRTSPSPDHKMSSGSSASSNVSTKKVEPQYALSSIFNSSAAPMSSPDEEPKLKSTRRNVVNRINSLQLRTSLDEVPTTPKPVVTSSSEARFQPESETADAEVTPTIQRRKKSAEVAPSMAEESATTSTCDPGAAPRFSSRARVSSLVSCFCMRKLNRSLGSIQFNLTYHTHEKKLVVHLIRGKNLKAMDSNGFSDPYVKLHLLPGIAKATKLTSKTIEKTLNPEWNEELVYYGITEEDKQKKTLRITVLDRDRIGSDFLGETRVALRKLPNNTTKKYNLYLEHAIPVPAQTKQSEEEERGKIHVGLQYNIQQGSLFVHINRCVELIGMDSTGFSDPYCKVSLTPITSKAHRQRTSIKKRTLNPEFNETIQFVVPFKDLPKKTLQIGVYDHDLGKHDDYIGGILLSASAKDERGLQWIKCIENPGTLVENWHKLELDS
ncbi:unnamed protein product [Caenorhabditis bovis]|uniref:Uncharacterized protein n=1 Tax=Caenorhabditis bovis TaxID=2654633 RepID=A0A8S1EIM6_9PELO|nr:unnamed protein product [Caenorhabditis bovis]